MVILLDMVLIWRLDDEGGEMEEKKDDLHRPAAGFAAGKNVRACRYVLLSRAQASPARGYKQEKEETSRIYVQTFIFPSVKDKMVFHGVKFTLNAIKCNSTNDPVGTP